MAEAEPLLDFSQIAALYKEDARDSVSKMQVALERWGEVMIGGPARLELRRLSHQLRGSGRTYGFSSASRVAKAMERMIEKLEKNTLEANERLRAALADKVHRLGRIFA